jgi:hypothetical protein
VFTVRASLILLLAGSPLAAGAQSAPAPDTTPFHRSQWAAQFAGGVNLVALGALRFTAPTRAWLVDFSFTAGHTHSTDHFSDTLVAQGFTSDANVALRLGRRFYQGRGRSVTSFQTLGALGGFVTTARVVRAFRHSRGGLATTAGRRTGLPSWERRT